MTHDDVHPGSLIDRWRAQLGAAERGEVDPGVAGPDWYVAIRRRVLTYLVRRYGQDDVTLLAPRPEDAAIRPAPDASPATEWQGDTWREERRERISGFLVDIRQSIDTVRVERPEVFNPVHRVQRARPRWDDTGLVPGRWTRCASLVFALLLVGMAALVGWSVVAGMPLLCISLGCVGLCVGLPLYFEQERRRGLNPRDRGSALD